MNRIAMIESSGADEFVTIFDNKKDAIFEVKKQWELFDRFEKLNHNIQVCEISNMFEENGEINYILWDSFMENNNCSQ